MRRKTNQRLGIHRSVVCQEIDSFITIRCLNHDNPVHGRILRFERNCRPCGHGFLRFLHGSIGKIHIFNIPLFFVHHILIPGALLILGEPKSHGLAPVIGLINGFLQQIHVQLHLDGQAGTDI